KGILMHDVSQPIERLGNTPYNWWNEAQHGGARAGLATVYPQPIGMADTFDDQAGFDVCTDAWAERRVKTRAYVQTGEYGRSQRRTMWTPTSNIYRDPRGGRGIETYGEDPYLTSLMGVAAVKGLQGASDEKYDK